MAQYYFTNIIMEKRKIIPETALRVMRQDLNRLPTRTERFALAIRFWKINNPELYAELIEMDFKLSRMGCKGDKIFYILEAPDLFLNEVKLIDCFDHTLWLIDPDGYPVVRLENHIPFEGFNDTNLIVPILNAAGERILITPREFMELYPHHLQGLEDIIADLDSGRDVEAMYWR